MCSLISYTVFFLYITYVTDTSGSVKDKNRSTYVSDVTASSKRSSGSKKTDPLSPGSSSGHHRGRRSRRGQEERDREGGDWSNLPASNLPEDWGREKEVTEEKQMSTGEQNCITSSKKTNHFKSSPQRFLEV